MIKKQILNNRSIEEIESNLLEVESTIKEALVGASYIKQVFEASLDKGMSMHSVNTINIKSVEVDYFNGNLVINVNHFEFSLSMNKECSITIQRPQPGMKCRIFLNDFKMWIIIN
jgi:hypothetical protein